MVTPTTIRWGIIGPGGIARTFRDGLRASKTGQLSAIATRDPGNPDLAEDFAGIRILEGYETLLRDPDIDAVYISTPHDSHAEWAIKSAGAGKHAFVEKPMAINAREAEAMIAAARKAGTFLGEAFMYRFHPLTQKLGELAASGVIGDVRMIQSSFGLQMEEFKPGHRLYSRVRGGGGILDLGTYPVSMARFIAGAASGKPFLDPVAVSGAACLGLDGVDEWASATLTFSNGIIAELSASVSVARDNILRIFGATGWIEVPDFWSAGGGRDGGPGTFEIVREEGPRTPMRAPGDRHLYSYEIDAVGASLAARRTEFAAPGMSWADSLGNMRALDDWRAAAGLEYDADRPDAKGPMAATQ
ncbi:MAG: Gfo/Idh/MocA family oxidoreductase [Hyphomicrobiaceae bacterium]|nr:Gfo/Idh/MocA family oxidoreductase [Hyphomicrobiaceae bacterium]